MKTKLFAILLILLSASCSHGNDFNAGTFVESMPSIFWYAWEIHGEKPRGTDTGYPHHEFKSICATEIISNSITNGSRLLKVKLTKVKGDDVGEWYLTFKISKKKIKPLEAYTVFDGTKFDLFEQEFGEPAFKPDLIKSINLYLKQKLPEAIKNRIISPMASLRPGGPQRSDQIRQASYNIFF